MWSQTSDEGLWEPGLPKNQNNETLDPSSRRTVIQKGHHCNRAVTTIRDVIGVKLKINEQKIMKSMLDSLTSLRVPRLGFTLTCITILTIGSAAKMSLERIERPYD